MKSFCRQSLADQTAIFLRDAIASGRWKKILPGLRQLCAELGVSRTSVERALKILTQEGLLVPPQARKPRQLAHFEVHPRTAKRPRVAWLLDQPLHLHDAPTRENVAVIRESAERNGCEVLIPKTTLLDLPNPRSTLPALVTHYQADIWMVLSGSREVLQWYCEQPFPTLAIGGRNLDLPIAGIGYSMPEIVKEAVRTFLTYGHRRIVMPVQKAWQVENSPSRAEQVFREEMESAGLRVSKFNLPHIGDTSADFLSLLGDLFRLTPPTALLLHRSWQLVALQSFLMARRLTIPTDVSVIMTINSPTYEWIRPAPMHFLRAPSDLSKAVGRWLKRAMRGDMPREKIDLPTVLVPGGSVSAPMREQ